MKQSTSEMFMQEAIRQARVAASKDEVPVGAVVVHENKIIARAYNQVELLKDPTAHAEMIAITAASNYLGAKWLTDCALYVTLEPCSMCAGALVLARMRDLHFGANDPKSGACGSLYKITTDPRLNHQVAVEGGILADACGEVLTEFFQKKRSRGKG